MELNFWSEIPMYKQTKYRIQEWFDIFGFAFWNNITNDAIKKQNLPKT